MISMTNVRGWGADGAPQFFYRRRKKNWGPGELYSSFFHYLCKVGMVLIV